MRLLVALFLALHGIAHLFGFRAAFWPALGLRARTNWLGGLVGVGYVGTRALGVLWLVLAIGYVLAAALFLLRSPGWVGVTLTVTVASAMTCLLFWPDARIGLFIDIMVFVIVLTLSRSGGEYLAQR